MESINIDIIRKEHRKVTWTIKDKLKYNDILYFINETKNDTYFDNLMKKDIECIRCLKEYENDVILILEQLNKGIDHILNEDSGNYFEIYTKSKRNRYILYNLCKILKYKYEVIYEHCIKYVGCNEFIPKHLNEYRICGCDYAPKIFRKHHVRDNYEDTIAYSNIPRTYKRGLKNFCQIISFKIYYFYTNLFSRLF